MNATSRTSAAAGSSRIAITGVGAVTALGQDAASTFGGLIGGACGFQPVTLFDASAFRCGIAAQITPVPTPDHTAPGAYPWSRLERFALHAAREALRQARIDPLASPIGLVMGTTTSWIHEAEQLLSTPSIEARLALGRHLLQHPQGDSVERIASALGQVPRCTTVSSACSSGSMAIVLGATWLELGLIDRVLVGAADTLCLLTYAGFEAISALSSEACRPFDRQRNGMSLGEGAGFLVLEREADAVARGSELLAFLSGWAVGSEAHHATLPEASAQTAIGLFREAMQAAGISPADVSYINAHGTGTIANDAMEAYAIRSSLGSHCDQAWVSSCKGQLGHTLAAAGAIEAVVCAMSLRQGIVPPTLGLSEPDPALPLRHVRERGIACSLQVALSSSFGFGGNGVVLAFEHSSWRSREPREVVRGRDVFIASACAWQTDGRSAFPDATSHGDEQPVPPDAMSPRDALTLLDPSRSRRFDPFSALVCINAEWALNQTGLQRGETGLAVGFSYGPVERLSQFLERIVASASRRAAPAEFPHVVPSAAAGNASVYLGLKGPTFVVADARMTSEATLLLASDLIRAGSSDSMIVSAASVDDPLMQAARASLSNQPSDGPSDVVGGVVAIVSQSTAEQSGTNRLIQLVNVAVARHPSLIAAAMMPPQLANSTAILCHTWTAALAQAIAGTAWAQAKRMVEHIPAAVHEVAGMVALARGIDLIEQGIAQEVLVWTEVDDHHALQHLRAWPCH